METEKTFWVIFIVFYTVRVFGEAQDLRFLFDSEIKGGWCMQVDKFLNRFSSARSEGRIFLGQFLSKFKFNAGLKADSVQNSPRLTERDIFFDTLTFLLVLLRFFLGIFVFLKHDVEDP